MSSFVLLRCVVGAERIEPSSNNTITQTVSAAELRADALTATNSLKTVRVVDAPTFKQFVRDRTALQRLGKTLFWDQQLGSDGQSCASCHFHAGADNRSKNQANPGFRNTTVPGGDQAFSPSATGALPLGANRQLVASDFPFHKLADVNDRLSAVIYDTNDVVSSQGVLNAGFRAVRAPMTPDWPADVGAPMGGVFADPGVRNVEPRNTPTSHRTLGRGERCARGVPHRAHGRPRAIRPRAFDHPSLVVANGGGSSPGYLRDYGAGWAWFLEAGSLWRPWAPRGTLNLSALRTRHWRTFSNR